MIQMSCVKNFRIAKRSVSVLDTENTFCYGLALWINSVSRMGELLLTNFVRQVCLHLIPDAFLICKMCLIFLVSAAFSAVKQIIFRIMEVNYEIQVYSEV